jgi:hypothetical protein
MRSISDSKGDSDSEYGDDIRFMISELTSPVHDLTKVWVSTQKFDCKGIPIGDSENGEEEELIETSPPDILRIFTTLSAEIEVATLTVSPPSIISPHPRTRAEVRKR